MPDRKCPMCDGTCVLKVIATKTTEVETVDVCSLCGSIFRRDEKRAKNEGGR